MNRIFSSLVVLFVLLIATPSYAVKVTGVILDEITKQAVPYVNICIENESRGTSSEFNGKFTLNLVKDNDLQKTVIISSVGYVTKKVKISNIANSKQAILLTPKVSALSAVEITTKKGRTIKLDRIKKSPFNMRFNVGSSAPFAYVKLFHFDAKYENMALRTIRMKFGRYDDSDKEIAIIVRVLSMDLETGLPSEDLISKTIVKLEKCKPTNQYVFEYNLEEFVEFPKDGVFVGLEWIYIKENETTNEYGSYVAPMLVSKYNTKENNTYRFSSGKWEEYTELSNAVPYIELQISE